MQKGSSAFFISSVIDRVRKRELLLFGKKRVSSIIVVEKNFQLNLIILTLGHLCASPSFFMHRISGSTFKPNV